MTKSANKSPKSKQPIERLRILRRWLAGPVSVLLEKNKKNRNVRFDMTQWASAQRRDTRNAVSCGYTACAIGWGALCPALRDEGLRLNPWQDVLVPHVLVDHISDDGRAWQSGAAILAGFFGIGEGEAERLFYANQYRAFHPKLTTVIARIDKVLARHDRRVSKERGVQHE